MQKLNAWAQKLQLGALLDSLRYALYVIFHPFDGFWDLKNEKRGSVKAASVLVLLVLLTRLWQLQFSGFLFVEMAWKEVNIWLEVFQILIPFAIWCIANWCLTTLFDGKGGMKDIYITTAYALTPYILVQIPLILLSNVITQDEGALYNVFSGISYLWCGGLLLAGMMQTHEYTMLKTVAFTLFTIVGMIVIMVLCLMFFCMAGEAIGYFTSLIRELSFRLY